MIKAENPCYIKLANTWIILNPGAGPTPCKPEVFLVTPSDLSRVNSSLNLRVADIWACYKQRGDKAAIFLTEPLDNHGWEWRCYMRDPDGYLNRGRPIYSNGARLFQKLCQIMTLLTVEESLFADDNNRDHDGWECIGQATTLQFAEGYRRSTPFRFIAAQYYTEEMSKHLESLYQNLLNGKLPHNLSWSEAVELVEHLGEVQPHGHDEFVFRVGSQRVFFKRPHTHDLGVEEVSRLRKFLQEAGSGEHIEEPAKPPRMIVVIDHHAAHVYQDFGGSRPADEHEVRPYDPFNFHHHLIHRKEAHYRGERVPEEHSFYEEVAKDLTSANEIVLIGHATGKSNAADFLKEYLKTHHPDISRRVIATESADLSAVTEPEIEALAKRHMIAVVQQRGS